MKLVCKIKQVHSQVGHQVVDQMWRKVTPQVQWQVCQQVLDQVRVKNETSM